jgi:hypothetical protein
MVAIVTGNGLGLQRSSANVLGSRGQLGNASLGRANENVYLNVANGNLILSHQDEVLLGRGPDSYLNRTYNSQGGWDGDNNDQWRMGAVRRVTLTTASNTINLPGSSAIRIDWDGSETLYTWDVARSAYVSREGSGAYDILTYNTGTSAWSWTDGASQATDIYDNSGANGGRIIQSKDTDGNQVTYAYGAAGAAGKLLTITTADGNFTTLTYTRNNLYRSCRRLRQTPYPYKIRL